MANDDPYGTDGSVLEPQLTKARAPLDQAGDAFEGANPAGASRRGHPETQLAGLILAAHPRRPRRCRHLGHRQG